MGNIVMITLGAACEPGHALGSGVKMYYYFVDISWLKMVVVTALILGHWLFCAPCGRCPSG
jgi:hypothetical protein